MQTEKTGGYSKSNRRIDIAELSSEYRTRLLTEDDIPAIYELCSSNPQYYESHCIQLSRDLIIEDMTELPPGKTEEEKYYFGFFDKADELIAVMDLIDGYPSDKIAYIGFFMVAARKSGRGVGTEIITELCESLNRYGFSAVRLAYGKHNPQSTHFWRKNGFEALREVEHEKYGRVIVAECNILRCDD